MSTPSADANVRAFLMMLREAEGTPGELGFRALFGFNPKTGRPTFDSYATHPRVLKSFTNTEGKVQFSTAAGAFQINAPTFDDLVKRHHDEWVQLARTTSGGFSPDVQIAMALWKIREAGALEDIEAGRIQEAITKTAHAWASLPGGDYPQRRRSWHFALNAFTENGGTLTA